MTSGSRPAGLLILGRSVGRVSAAVGAAVVLGALGALVVFIVVLMEPLLVTLVGTASVIHVTERNGRV